MDSQPGPAPLRGRQPVREHPAIGRGGSLRKVRRCLRQGANQGTRASMEIE